MAKVNIKQLASSRLSGFRHKPVSVPEWEGAKVIIREPSAEAWLRWKGITQAGEDEQLSQSEKAQRNLRGDVTLFIDVLLDEDKMPVFTPEDEQNVPEFYGPVHARILKQALDLISSDEDVQEK